MILGALLLNPPTTSGEVTKRHLAAAAKVLTCESVEIANMCRIPTRSVIELNLAARDASEWLASRGAVERVIQEADVLLAAWGVAGLSGASRRNMIEQCKWLMDQIEEHNQTLWTVGASPRHPSRWHQYVSDKHGRAGVGTLEDRLRRVMIENHTDGKHLLIW